MSAALPDALALEPTRPLLRREYDQLVELGVLDSEPVELIEGRMVVMSPEGAPHASTISKLGRLLVLALDGRAIVRVASPLAVSDSSEPEPDLAAVDLEGDFDVEHPETAFLVVEVSHSSLRKDRFVKPALYAGAGVPEYWIVDLTADTVTVLREPVDGGYASTVSRVAGQSIALVAFPDVTIALDDFLPRRA